MSEQTNQELVKFYQHEILTFEQEGNYYVAMKPIAEAMGVGWEGQRQRLERDDLFNSTTCMIQVVAEDGKQREMVSLPVEMFPMWLATIDTSRVKNIDAKATILQYQREAAKVLFEHFFISKQKAHEQEAIANYGTLKELVLLQREKLDQLAPRMNFRGKMYADEKAYIVKLWRTGKSTAQLVAETGRSESSIRKVIKEANTRDQS